MRGPGTAQHAEGDTYGKFGGLANGTAVPDHQFLAQHDHIGEFFDVEKQRFVESTAIGQEHVERQAKGRLLADEEPQSSEIGQAACLRHQQSEAFDAAALGRRFEQPAHRLERNEHVRSLQALRRKAEFPQHPRRVEPELAGDLGVVREACAADDATGQGTSPHVPNEQE
jgi:hypothetical protein